MSRWKNRRNIEDYHKPDKLEPKKLSFSIIVMVLILFCSLYVTTLRGYSNVERYISDEIGTASDADYETATSSDAEVEEVATSSEAEIDGGNPFTTTGFDAESYGQLSLVKFTAIANGYLGGLGLDSSGFVWSWGWNGHGALGLGNTSGTAYAGGMKRITRFVENGTPITDVRIKEIASGYHNRMILAEDGTVYAWGHNANGELGNGTTAGTINHTPTSVTGLPFIQHIYASNGGIAGSNFAMDSDGNLWAWGSNGSGQLGLNVATATITKPTKVQLPADIGVIKKVVVGQQQAHIIDDQGNVYSTGSSTYGALGNGATTGIIRSFFKINKPNGMGAIVDISTSYTNTVAVDENGTVWQWGLIYGKTSIGSTISIATPEKVIVSASEISDLGYTPLAKKVGAGERVLYFIDQHGRSWAWGSGAYFGFGREGGYENSNDQYSGVAIQYPKEIGDGDTQIYDTSEKSPKYLSDPANPKGIAANTYGNYSFNPLHPTIYDEKYMKKDGQGNVVDEEGTRLIYQRGNSGNFKDGFYYKLDAGGTKTSVTGIPAVATDDKVWIDVASKPLPYLVEIWGSRSAYAVLDRDGNIYKWGNDGSGSIAWGWDYNSKYDSNGNLTQGLYDRYTYEVMYMRGSPSMEAIRIIDINKTTTKIYKQEDAEVPEFDTATIKIQIPAKKYSVELEQEISTSINKVRYIVVPYDRSNPHFNKAELEEEEFTELYNSGEYQTGNLLSAPLLAENEMRVHEIPFKITDNCKVFFMVDSERFSANALGEHVYSFIDYVPGNVMADNFYTPTTLMHRGVGEEENIALYAPTNHNVQKVNIDGQPDVLYGLPLDNQGNVIGNEQDLEITKPPTFGYDTVKIHSYEAKNQEGIPAGILPYWKWKDKGVQEEAVEYTLNQKQYLSQNETSFTKDFIYEKDLDNWVLIEGTKVWDDKNDAMGLRPEKISFTLYKYQRDVVVNPDFTLSGTGALRPGTKEKIQEFEVTPDENGKWKFDMGLYMAFEYTYRIEETPIEHYSSDVKYPNQITGTMNVEDISDITITNKVVFVKTSIIKVDEDGETIVDSPAAFTMSAIEPEKKVFDETGQAVEAITFSTQSGIVMIPPQPIGVYQIKETKAPKGYNKLTNDITLTILDDQSVTVQLGGKELEVTKNQDEDGNFIFTFPVVNMERGVLPFTGGTGTIMFTLIGLSMLLFVIIYASKENIIRK